ncbi:MAG: hypothetical protein ABIB71_03010 [Candidatus Woesearchaeota archaeon]
MNYPNEGRLIDFVKDGLQKGYGEETIINMMREHNITEDEMNEVMEEAKRELAGIQAEPSQEESPAQPEEPGEQPAPAEESPAQPEESGEQPAEEVQEEVPPTEQRIEEVGKELEEAESMEQEETHHHALDALRQREGLYSVLLIIVSFAIMLAVYIGRMFGSVSEIQLEGGTTGIGLRLIKALWPLAFPLAANTANFFLFRRHFKLCLIISMIILGSVLLVLALLTLF